VDVCRYIASRLISFRTQQFCTLALVQDAHVNMPYQSWQLRPRAANHAQLTVTAAVVELEIQIKVYDSLHVYSPHMAPLTSLLAASLTIKCKRLLE